MQTERTYCEKSLLSSRWILTQADQDQIARIVSQHNIPEMIARLLSVRGIAEDQIERFLNPTLAKDFPDPAKMKNMPEAASFIAEAIKAGRKIGVFGDFDVDGATSVSILVRFFSALGQNIPLHIPDRLKEGYGPNVDALAKLKDQGAEIVLICDCGTTAHKVIADGRALGLDIIVLDHHEAEDTLPDANFVVNPKQSGDESGYEMLAACGVVFLFCVAVNAALRSSGYYKENKVSEPDLRAFLDLLALGTVCDMVPLTDCNRLFVKHGFDKMRHTTHTGLRALINVSGIGDRAVNVYDAGFILGPRINAGSRVFQADLGAKLLSSDDADASRDMAWTLNDCNDKRKDIQAEMLDHAISIVERERLAEQRIIIAGNEQWHPGLSGLVAGKLKEKYGKPAVAITYATNEKGVLEGRGSGRSVPGVNMGEAFMAAEKEGLLIKGGGHAMAAGFSVEPDKIEPLKTFLHGYLEKHCDDVDSLPQTYIDSVLSVSGVTVPLVKMMEEEFGPFGQEHAQPKFLFQSVKLSMIDVVGGKHIKAMMSDWEGGSSLKVIMFGGKDTPAGAVMLEQGYNKIFDVVGTLKINSWNGRETAEVQINDIIISNKSMD